MALPWTRAQHDALERFAKEHEARIIFRGYESDFSLDPIRGGVEATAVLAPEKERGTWNVAIQPDGEVTNAFLEIPEPPGWSWR